MQISARNQLKGIVKKVGQGAVNSEITIELSGGIETESIITKQSVEHLISRKGRLCRYQDKRCDDRDRLKKGMMNFVVA
jgi:molybdopterin-binding protein